MHPALILIPAAALIVLPRWWVGRVMSRHDAEDEGLSAAASAVARELLDRHGLYAVAVEATDVGDHYDPTAKAVRLARPRFDRKSLTAVTTAAHEVAHAVQDATSYPPFEWRQRLAQVARITGQAGGVLLLAAPLTLFLTRRPLPMVVIGTTALGMLGTGIAAQLAALPTEFDASFRRALPMLAEGYVADDQLPQAREILIASSLTYVASSLVGVLHIWPWIGRPQVALLPNGEAVTAPGKASGRPRAGPVGTARRGRKAGPRSLRGGAFEATFRRIAKPVLRKVLTYR